MIQLAVMVSKIGKDIVKKSIEEIAERFLQFMNDGKGKFLEAVRIKGDGHGFYYSASAKKLLFIPRNRLFYLVPNRKPDEMGRIMVFMPDGIMSGEIIMVNPKHLEPLGEN
jgi:hypothetical protein